MVLNIKVVRRSPVSALHLAPVIFGAKSLDE